MKSLVTFILFSLLYSTSAQPFTVPLFDGKIPNSKPSKVEEEIEKGDILVIRKVVTPHIEVFLPAKRQATGQAVLICPGGGYGVLAYDWEGYDIAKWLNSQGIAGIVLKYRLPNAESQLKKELSPLIDAKRGMRLVRHNAEEWGIDPHQIGVMGFSAGGHLASTLGTHFDEGDASASDPIEKLSSRPDFMILAYPVISFDPEICHMGSRTNLIGENPSKELEVYYSSEKQVKPDTPPTFIFHSQDDQSVKVANSLVMYRGLIEKGIPVDAHFFPTGGHGYSLGINTDDTYGNWPEYCADWLRKIRE
ncbi:MAG: alpha/beta hydrolase [Cyclobacteriaceae bacterium]